MAKKEKEVDEEIIEEVVEKEGDTKGKIVIEESDFKMISSRPNDMRFFDLYLIHIVNKGKPTERSEFKLVGYGIQLKNCLIRIANVRAVNDPDQTHFTSFKQFVAHYKKYVDEVKLLFDQLPQNLD